MTLVSGLPKLPLRLGRYEVGATLAGGGMARVLVGRTWNDDGSERLVALKVIHDSLEDQEEFVHMFLDEGRLLSRIVHPNVVRTLEVGVNGSVRYIAMELLQGRSLFDVWELGDRTGRRLPVELAAWVCAEVAAGLHAAHELTGDDGESLGLVHRDVNPSNIILTFEGEVKLIDFGLAKSRGQRTKSQAGIVKGKLPYLSPEQTHMEPIDRRVDVFSLGATLWELTTGKRLFKRESDVDTLRAVRDGSVPEPKGIVADYPEALQAVVLKALARAPDDRFATAADFGAALAATVSEAPAALRARLVAFLAEAFPGEQAAQSQRTHAPRSVPPPSLGGAPEPAATRREAEEEEPVPLSSSLLGELPDDESEPAPSPRAAPPPLVKRGTLPPEGEGSLPVAEADAASPKVSETPVEEAKTPDAKPPDAKTPDAKTPDAEPAKVDPAASVPKPKKKPKDAPDRAAEPATREEGEPAKRAPAASTPGFSPSGGVGALAIVLLVAAVALGAAWMALSK
ncbi:MAG: protein kinase [Myxococcales bacterium]|nr:protein kinase [Myxococcales bacterium]